MKSCPECKEELIEDKKFCPGCGFNVSQFQSFSRSNEDDSILNKETIFDDENGIVEHDLVIQKTTKQLGINLEEMVEKIFKDRGFQTQTRQKLRGKSEQFNEIDVLATRGKVVIAIECKNYREGSKVGIKEIRDFTSKLDDLSINKGLFATSSDFSADAVGWATNNPQMKQIDLWNGNKLMEKYKAVVLGRSNSKIIKVENCLKPKNDIEHYSILLLKNKENVSISRRDLIFNPYYIVGFRLREQFKTPDKQIHSTKESGQFIVDAMSNSILYSKDEHSAVPCNIDNQQQLIVQDLLDMEPHKIVEIPQEPNSKIHVNQPSTTKKDVEFYVRNIIIENYKRTISYTVRKSKDDAELRDYPHSPDESSISLQSKLVFVPKFEISFDSKEYNYVREILPVSDVTIIDEITVCKHILGNKHTFAVCETCGKAKCEGDIRFDKQGKCYCKDHAPE